MVLWEFFLTEENELIQLTDNLSKADQVRQEIWDELKAEGKTNEEIVKIFVSFGL